MSSNTNNVSRKYLEKFENKNVPDLNNNNKSAFNSKKTKQENGEFLEKASITANDATKIKMNNLKSLVNGDNNANHSEWNIRASKFAQSTLNPVRRMLEQMKMEPNPQLPVISLSIGDPTVMSNLAKPDTVITAITNCINDKSFDGYTPSQGTVSARTAVANYYSKPDNLVYKFSDIILTNGCSQALDLCITVLANRGQNILIPKPGFSIYKTLCGTLDINVKYYNLLENNNWEIDLDEVESLIDENTVSIVVNNPSNPCGSVYSKEHLIKIIKLAEKHRLPIIADEVYGDMVFPGNDFY